MIQDRLTAKFQSAKPAKRREAKPAQPVVKAKAVKAPAADMYTRGRRIAASFWL